MSRKNVCHNLCCKHHQEGDCCDVSIEIDVNGKCKNFEKGLAYYFNLVWQALQHKNYVDAIELNQELKIGLYCVMKAYNLGFSEMEWGTCRMVALRAGKDGPMLKTGDILAMKMDKEQIQNLSQELETGTLPHSELVSPVKAFQPYGWPSPVAEFVEGDFGEHDAVARMIIRKKGFWDEFQSWRAKQTGTCRDFLSRVKGYCLIHNPSGGGGYLVSCEKPLTKRQKDFLYGYFMEIGDRFKAEQFIAEESS